MAAFQIRRLFCLNFSRLIESQTPERVSLGSLRLEETAEIQAKLSLVSLPHLFYRLSCSSIRHNVHPFCSRTHWNTSIPAVDHTFHVCCHRNRDTRTVYQRICKTSPCSSSHKSWLSLPGHAIAVVGHGDRSLYSNLHILLNTKSVKLSEWLLACKQAHSSWKCWSCSLGLNKKKLATPVHLKVRMASDEG